MVNSYKAPVKWFKGDKEIAVEEGEQDEKYLVEKDILGHCKLTVFNAQKADAGTYKCKIENTKHVTKCAVALEGTRSS